MNRKKTVGMGILILGVLGKLTPPVLIAGSPSSDGNVIIENANPQVVHQVETVLPEAVRMVDTAINTLGKGWDEMSSDERSLFLQFYDPGNTGGVNAAFVQKALENYQVIRRGFDRGFRMIYQPESSKCVGMRLYYTDFFKIYMCPFIHQETNPMRMARDLVHETAHMSLLVLDRPYYSVTDSRYKALTPEGHWMAGLPIVGTMLREIARADTLYHPDAYSRYAWALIDGISISTTNGS